MTVSGKGNNLLKKMNYLLDNGWDHTLFGWIDPVEDLSGETFDPIPMEEAIAMQRSRDSHPD